jgi:hypothetical protein
MHASGLTYTCAPGVAVATCNYLNTAVAGLYNSTFTNANADIYIQYGATGLGSSNTVFNGTTYFNYLLALANNPDKDALQNSALNALANFDTGQYGFGNVALTTALDTTLGFSGAAGLTSTDVICTIGSAGCYDGVITITNNPGTPLYYDNLGGPEPSNAYDYYAVVQHETDEVLGTSSCISTQSPSLSDTCNVFGTGTPSAVDLFRYSAPGSLVLDSSLSTAPALISLMTPSLTEPTVLSTTLWITARTTPTS